MSNERIDSGTFLRLVQDTQKVMLKESKQEQLSEEVVELIESRNNKIYDNIMNTLAESLVTEYGDDLTEEQLNELFGGFGAAIGGALKHIGKSVGAAYSGMAQSARAAQADYYTKAAAKAAGKAAQHGEKRAERLGSLADMTGEDETGARRIAQRQAQASAVQSRRGADVARDFADRKGDEGIGGKYRKERESTEADLTRTAGELGDTRTKLSHAETNLERAKGKIAKRDARLADAKAKQTRTAKQARVAGKSVSRQRRIRRAERAMHDATKRELAAARSAGVTHGSATAGTGAPGSTP